MKIRREGFHGDKFVKAAILDVEAGSGPGDSVAAEQPHPAIAKAAER